MPGGEAPVTNWELVYKHQVHVIGLNIGVLIQATPQIFGEVMGELSGLMAAGVPCAPMTGTHAQYRRAYLLTGLSHSTGAAIIGFNVRAHKEARELAERVNVEIRYYNII